MIVVTDTSPINYLVLIDEIDILPKLFGKVILPEAVWKELNDMDSPDEVLEWVEDLPVWIDIRAARKIDTTINLDRGEQEAISLAKELNADLLLVDDRKARNVAIELGYNIAGTINILESAHKRDLVDLKRAFKSLQQTNFRISEKLIEEILERNS
jgi:predicted nucleic acid-binding protein